MKQAQKSIKPARSCKANAAVCTADRARVAGSKLAIEYKSPHELEPDPRNARLHSKKQVHQLAESIRQFGFVVPVLLNTQHRIVAGHGRVEAAKILGFSSIPTITLDHLSPTQATALAIADNKLVENSAWDEEVLAEELKSLLTAELDFNVEAIGFETAEVDLLIEGLEGAHSSRKDPADKVPEKQPNVAVSKDGDLWTLGQHRILCGNSLNEESFSVLMDKKASAIFSDPLCTLKIYGHTRELCKTTCESAVTAGAPDETECLTRVCSLLAANSVDGSLHYLFADWRHLPEILAAGRAAYQEFVDLCVWAKRSAETGSLYRSQHELIFVFKRGTGAHQNNIQHGRLGRCRTNVWDYRQPDFARRAQKDNFLETRPAAKPIALVVDALLDSTHRGDVVLDAFLGIGTTLVAAERCGRICNGIETDPICVDMTIRRWQAFTGLSATHVTSKRSFNDLEQEVLAQDGQKRQER